MTEKEVKLLSESMIELSNLTIQNTLTYLKSGLEAFKKCDVPIIDSTAQNCVGIKNVYKKNDDVRMFVDFLIVFLDEAIKNQEEKLRAKKDKSE